MKIFIAAGLAVLLLVVGIGIPVMAADDPVSPTPPVAITKQAGLWDRVAQILNIPKDTLVNAAKQAAQELKGTKPTADDYFNKVAAILGNGMTKDILVNALQQAAKETRDANINARLDKAVQNNVITPDEEQQIKDWYAARPSAVDKLLNLRSLRNMKIWGWLHNRIGKIEKNAPNKPNATPSPSTTAFSPAYSTSNLTY